VQHIRATISDLQVAHANRRAAEALAADEADIAALEEMEKAAQKGWKKEGKNA
jgi:hypothetical protein